MACFFVACCFVWSRDCVVIVLVVLVVNVVFAYMLLFGFGYCCVLVACVLVS